MKLSKTLETLADMTLDEVLWWGNAVYERVGDRVFVVAKDLAYIPKGLRATLKTCWVSLQAADDIKGESLMEESMRRLKRQERKEKRKTTLA